MADYIVNVGVRDNATQQLNNIEKGFDNVGRATEELDKIKQRFDKITSSAAPAKKQLRDLQNIMAAMNLKGLANTDVFTEVAQKAGVLKDAMADAQQAVRAYSNDVFNLQAAAEGFTSIAAAGSIATSTMALFGSENKEVEKILLKVQAAQGVLNGVTAIANVLNKDSALMLKIKQIRLAANTAAQVKDTIATTANTVATGANTAATVASTVAQNGWNVAKAIGKAMIGDFTGLVLLGIGAMTTYAIATSAATDAEEERNQTLTEAQQLAKKRTETEHAMAKGIANAASQQLAAYFSLQQKWNECNGDVAKQTQFMSDYKDEIHNTGFAVNDLQSAENFFVNNTDAVVQAIMQRARAQAAYEIMVDNLKRSLEKLHEKSVRSGDYMVNVTNANATQAEREYARQQLGRGAYNYSYSTDDNFNSLEFENGLSEKALKLIQEKRKREATERKRQWQADIRQEINDNTKFYADIVKDSNGKLAEIRSKYGLTEYKPPKKTTTHTSPKKDDKPAAENSIADMEKDISDLETSLKKGLIPEESIAKTIDTIKELKDKVEKEKIRLGFTIAPAAGSIGAMQKELSKLKADLENGLIPDEDIENTKSQIDKLTKDIKAKKIELGIEPKIEEGSIASLQQQISELDKKLNNDKLTLYARIELQSKKEDLQKQIDAKTNLKDLTIKAAVEPTIIERGSIYDKRESYSNANSRIGQIQSDLESGIIDTDIAKSQIAEINQELQKLGLKPIQVHIKGDWDKFMSEADEAFNGISAIDNMVGSISNLTSKIEEGANAWDIFMSAISVVEGAMKGINTVMQITNMLTNLGTTANLGAAAASAAAGAAATEEATVQAATIAPKTAETIANRALEASVLDLAAAQIFAAHAGIPFAGPGIAGGLITGMMAAMAAQHAASAGLQALANGGVIRGSSTMGDHIIARVNAGEMVLNNRQQSNLFNAIDHNRLGGGGTIVGGEVRIKGSDLYIALKNFNKGQSTYGKNIGIR